MKHPPTTARAARPAFTFVELMLGMIILTLIMGAIGGLAYAVSTSWQASEASQNLQVASRQCNEQIERLVRSAKWVGLATADGQAVVGTGSQKHRTPVSPGASLMFWQDDGGNSLKLSSIVLIQHDQAGQTLMLYQVPPTASNANLSCAAADMNCSVAAEDFKTLRTTVGRVLARNVTSASFTANATPANGRPGAEFCIRFASGVQKRTEYGTATQRAPATAPN